MSINFIKKEHNTKNKEETAFFTYSDFDKIMIEKKEGRRMQNEILLLGKKIIVDASPVVLSYSPDENWKEVWDAKGGQWTYEDGYLVGCETENKGGILLSKKRFDKDVMMSFTVSSVLSLQTWVTQK